MTGTLTSSAPSADLEPFLGLFDDAGLGDSVWVDLEFDAIIAANWDSEPPAPPEQPTGLPAWWKQPRSTDRSGSRELLQSQVAVTKRHRRQRSPPD